MDTVETIRHGNGNITTIYQDSDAEGPDEWGDDGLLLLGWHRDFTVDRPGYRRADVLARFFPEDEDTGERHAVEDAEYHVFTLYAYIHSGVSLSLGRDPSGGCDPGGWDTSRLGVVLVSRAEWPDAGKARDAAASLVETWNQYLSGDVYGYVVHGANGTPGDSCWGFYGLETVREEARAAGDARPVDPDDEEDDDVRQLRRIAMHLPAEHAEHVRAAAFYMQRHVRAAS